MLEDLKADESTFQAGLEYEKLYYALKQSHGEGTSSPMTLLRHDPMLLTMIYGGIHIIQRDMCTLTPSLLLVEAVGSSALQSIKVKCGPAETEARLQQQHEEQVRAQTEGVARVSAALKLGEEDAAAAARLREELQKAWAALKASQDKVEQPLNSLCLTTSPLGASRLQ